ncbi:MAG: hypothetical protein ACK41T_13135, partial [Pseudobdellovibrio sp.]
PGNPQYGHNYGDRDSNSLKYYFVFTDPRFQKESMCTNIARELQAQYNLVVQWQKARNSTDGDCYCKKSSDAEGSFKRCNDPEAVANETTCPNPKEERNPTSGQCEAIVKTETSEPESSSKISASVFDSCLADLKNSQKACDDQSVKANSKCDYENEQQEGGSSSFFSKNTVKDVLSMASQYMVSKKAGTGALAECTKISLLGTGAVKALDLIKTGCAGEIKTCQTMCKKSNELASKEKAYFYDSCKRSLGVSDAEFTAKYKPVLDDELASYAKESKSIDSYCGAEVANKSDMLNDLVTDIGNAVTQADICRCQLSPGVTSVEECQYLLGPGSCLANPSQAGCQFSTAACTTPTNCPINTAAGSLSGLAAPTIAGGAGYNPETAGGSLKAGSVGNIDLGDLSGDNKPSAMGAPTQDGGAPFGNAQGGGGGFGGGGGGSGSSSGSAAEKDESDKPTGLAGLFNTAKSALGNLFGAGKSSTGSSSGNGKNNMNGKKYKNAEAFRPKSFARGLATDGLGLGGKNKDIWKMVNQRYGDQYHTFITVEKP